MTSTKRFPIGWRPVTVACLGAVLAGTLALLAFLPRQAEGANFRNCGTITFIDRGDYESGGLIKARGISCRKARKKMKKCGRKGIEPAGWNASAPIGALILRKGKKRIVAQLAGGSPPGVGRCVS